MLAKREELEGLSANLTPLGEPYRQSLIVTQLCLEEAPAELLPFAPPGCVGTSTWGPRMVAFLQDVLGLRMSDQSADIVAFLHGAHGSDPLATQMLGSELAAQLYIYPQQPEVYA